MPLVQRRMPVVQTIPHIPQLLGSLSMRVSQPSAMSPLQSSRRKSAHVRIRQVPSAQVVVPSAEAQVRPQAPQSLRVRIERSQPVSGSASQLEKPVSHEAIAQVRMLVQIAVA